MFQGARRGRRKYLGVREEKRSEEGGGVRETIEGVWQSIE